MIYDKNYILERAIFKYITRAQKPLFFSGCAYLNFISCIYENPFLFEKDGRCIFLFVNKRMKMISWEEGVFDGDWFIFNSLSPWNSISIEDIFDNGSLPNELKEELIWIINEV